MYPTVVRLFLTSRPGISIMMSTIDIFALFALVCKKTYHTPNTVRTHKNAHAALKHQCSTCLKCFNYAITYKQHKHVHLMLTQYKCFAGSCSQSYKWPQDLNRHVRIHVMGAKKHECLECGKSFQEECLLKHHATKHMNIFRYVCSKCGIKTKWLSCTGDIFLDALHKPH